MIHTYCCPTCHSVDIAVRIPAWVRIRGGRIFLEQYDEGAEPDAVACRGCGFAGEMDPKLVSEVYDFQVVLPGSQTISAVSAMQQFVASSEALEVLRCMSRVQPLSSTPSA